MTQPTAARIFDVLEATWPAASQSQIGAWTIRHGAGGGRRVSAATGPADGDIAKAEAAMSALDQPNIFMIRNGDAALDKALKNKGYTAQAPTSAYCCPIETLTADPVPPLSAFDIWPPLAIMDEIWKAGGIDAARQTVMQRSKSTKSAIFSRTKDRPAGAAYVAIHRQIAMIHAIEVAPYLRRNGTGINIMRAAAHWAQDNGAQYFSLLVTDANLAAIGLYKKMGLSVVGHYHYRIKEKQYSTEAEFDHTI